LPRDLDSDLGKTQQNSEIEASFRVCAQWATDEDGEEVSSLTSLSTLIESVLYISSQLVKEVILLSKLSDCRILMCLQLKNLRLVFLFKIPSIWVVRTSGLPGRFQRRQSYCD
jgi:hypothetical protein